MTTEVQESWLLQAKKEKENDSNNLQLFSSFIPTSGRKDLDCSKM